MDTAQRMTPYDVITDRILALLEQGTVPWHRPWASATGMPRNLFSQRSYRGINVWLLTAMGYASPFWATFQQVKTAGGSVRKGERGVPVVFWKIYDGHEDPETGEAEKRFVLRQYTVFNATQLDGVAIPDITVLTHRFTPIERCAHLVDAMPNRPTILHGHQRAFYKPATDTLHLPSPTCFQSPEAYYATVFHELVHSVGHRSRLNRPPSPTCASSAIRPTPKKNSSPRWAPRTSAACVASRTRPSPTARPTSRAGCRSCATIRPCWCTRPPRPRMPPIISKTSTLTRGPSTRTTTACRAASYQPS